MGKKRLSPRGPSGTAARTCFAAKLRAACRSKVKDGSALLHACEMDRSAKQYDHDGGTSAFGRPLFLKKNFCFPLMSMEKTVVYG